MIYMANTSKLKLLTPRQYSERHQVAYTTVMKWLQGGLIKGARKEPLVAPFQGYIYKIPADAQPPDLKPGPKPKSADQAATEQAVAAPAEKATKRKTGKKAEAKKAANK